MSNFASFVRESLERQVTPTRTLADLYAQMAASTGIDRERIQQLANGVITELSGEQVAGIARVLMVPAQRVAQIYANDLAELQAAGQFSQKERKMLHIYEDELLKLIESKVDELLRPYLVRQRELEDYALQRQRFEQPASQPQQPATAEKAISTGVPVPAFRLLTDYMSGRVRYAQPAPVEPVIPSATVPAFEALKRQLGALSV